MGSEEWPGNQDASSTNTSHVTTNHQFHSLAPAVYLPVRRMGWKISLGFYQLTQYMSGTGPVSRQVCLPFSEGLQGHFWAGCWNLTKERNCMSPPRISRFPSDLIQVLALWLELGRGHWAFSRDQQSHLLVDLFPEGKRTKSMHSPRNVTKWNFTQPNGDLQLLHVLAQ